MAATYLSRGGKQAGLNENLAREIMELHTVGVEAGYTQADVTEFARAMTGWSIGGLQRAATPASSVSAPPRTSPARAPSWARPTRRAACEQALAVMKDLAASPHTAHHVALKLARHFVADDPPPALVARLQRTFQGTGGDLAEVAKTLVLRARGLVARRPQKFKTPYEFLVSAWRAAGVVAERPAAGRPVLNDTGPEALQRPLAEGLAGGGRGLVRARRGDQAHGLVASAGRAVAERPRPRRRWPTTRSARA